jgi:NAD(P)-dependent dehydrogenase (short-subunit alcohol dehydrogenase family)
LTASLSGLVVVITGAARGIGRAAAEAFLARGARVVALDRSWDGAEAAAMDGTGLALVTTADITDPGSVAASRDAALARFGQVDVLINNAACRQRYLFPPDGLATVLGTTDEDWHAMVGVNVLGTLTATRSFVAPMLERGRGCVIVVGTRGSALEPVAPGIWRGHQPGNRNQPYDASKAALCSLSVYLAEELRDRGVAVNVVFPGPTFTTGSAEIAAGRRRLGVEEPPYLRPEHLVPLLTHLAAQTSASQTSAGLTSAGLTSAAQTGLVIDSVQWNRDHGLGDAEQWRYQPPA